MYSPNATISTLDAPKMNLRVSSVSKHTRCLMTKVSLFRNTMSVVWKSR
jgi:hypothetical protein